jgi:hypothetical protein
MNKLPAKVCLVSLCGTHRECVAHSAPRSLRELGTDGVERMRQTIGPFQFSSPLGPFASLFRAARTIAGGIHVEAFSRRFLIEQRRRTVSPLRRLEPAQGGSASPLDHLRGLAL